MASSFHTLERSARSKVPEISSDCGIFKFDALQLRAPIGCQTLESQLQLGLGFGVADSEHGVLDFAN